MFFTSSHSNNYVYSKGKIFLIHPLLSYASQTIYKEKNTLSSDELYYERKYSFLKKYGYLSTESMNTIKAFTPLCEEKVIYQLKKIKAISIEITEACNMQCEYCGYSDLYEQYGDVRKDNFIREDAVYALIAELYQYWKEEPNKEIEISFYGGEPLLGIEQIKNIISYIEKHYPQIHFIYKMTTNGLLLLKNMPYIIEHDIKVSVSIDGNRRHNGYRKLKNGGSSHELVVQVLDAIRKMYPDYYNNSLHVSAVLHHLNEIKEIQEYSKKRLGLFPYIGSLNTNNVKNVKKFMSMYRSKETCFSVKTHQGSIIMQQRPNEKHLEHFFHDVLHCSFKTIIDLLQQDIFVISPVQKTCLPFSKELFLTSKGKILPCETIARMYPLGYVTDKNNVILSPIYIADLYNEKVKELFKYCSSCCMLSFCFHCLFQVISVTEQKRKCPQYMGQKEFMNYLKVYVDYLELYPFEYSHFCIHN